MGSFAHENMSDEIRYTLTLNDEGTAAARQADARTAQPDAEWTATVVFADDYLLPRSRIEIFEMVEDLQVKQVSERQVGGQDLARRSRVVKGMLCKYVDSHAWWQDMEVCLRKTPLKPDSFWTPPKDVLDVSFLSDDPHELTVYNFGEFPLDETDEKFCEDVWRNIIRRTPADAMRPWHTINLLPPTNPREMLALADNTGVMLMTSNILVGHGDKAETRLEEVVAGMSDYLIQKKPDAHGGFDSVAISVDQYVEPWGVRKPELITL